MRAIVRSLVLEALNGPGNEEGVEWSAYAGGSIQGDSPPPRPFAVIRFGTVVPGMGNITERTAIIAIHDDGGDYGRIDAALGRIYARMDGAAHVSEPDGSAELILAEWTSTSDDLFDPGYRTLMKNSTYRLIGTGA